MPSLVENGSVVLEKKMKMRNDYRQTDGQTDKGQSEKLNWAFMHLIYKLNTFFITSANFTLKFFRISLSDGDIHCLRRLSQRC